MSPPRSSYDVGPPIGSSESFSAIYAQLHALARRQRMGWRGDHTLDTTALVHEAYLRLADGRQKWESPAHFGAVAARAMRHVLIDYARRRGAAKRGGGLRPVTLERVAGALAAGRHSHDSLPIDRLEDALERLATESERDARIVECRFFGGMSIPETAEALGVSPATVKRGWSFARAWLYRELSREE